MASSPLGLASRVTAHFYFLVTPPSHDPLLLRLRAAPAADAQVVADSTCAAGYEGTTGTCVICVAGKYCAGLANPAAPCNVGGNYCPAGSSAPQGVPCDAGTYCAAGTAAPVTCPAGYFCTYDERASDACVASLHVCLLRP
jgi:hypothetical protein